MSDGQPDYTGFGEYLRGQRELRGLTVDDVARSTKIPRTLVDALEEGQAERFPERVFVWNYVRSYATAVGLSPDETLLRFQEIPEAPRAEPFDPAALEAARVARAERILWSTVTAVALAAAALAWGAMVDLAARYANR